MHELLITIFNMRLRDVVDIVLVAVFFYGVFTLLRETRSFVALLGFVVCTVGSLVLFLVARTWNLQAMILLFQHFWIVFVLIFLIVFQNEFRRALTELGQMHFFRSFFPSREHGIIEEVEQAVITMAQARIGALICFERRNPLHPYTSTGKELDAVVSSELIRTVFTVRAPLHDGAMIIVGDRLLAAGCILPVSDNPELSSDLGTRHRAAIGLSEQTDALIVVVSEETGSISLVADGAIERGIKGEQLRRRLEQELHISSDDESDPNEEPAA